MLIHISLLIICFVLFLNKLYILACEKYQDHDILLSENDDFQIAIDGEEAPDGFLDAMADGKGWTLEIGSTVDIHDDGNGFDLLNISFDVNRPINMSVTLEYKNGTTQTTKVKAQYIDYVRMKPIICVFLFNASCEYDKNLSNAHGKLCETDEWKYI